MSITERIPVGVMRRANIAVDQAADELIECFEIDRMKQGISVRGAVSLETRGILTARSDQHRKDAFLIAQVLDKVLPDTLNWISEMHERADEKILEADAGHRAAVAAELTEL